MNKYTLSAILVSVCFVGACSPINKLIGVKDDWWGEEAIEDVLFKETGISIDLSSDSPEDPE